MQGVYSQYCRCGVTSAKCFWWEMTQVRMTLVRIFVLYDISANANIISANANSTNANANVISANITYPD